MVFSYIHNIDQAKALLQVQEVRLGLFFVLPCKMEVVIDPKFVQIWARIDLSAHNRVICRWCGLEASVVVAFWWKSKRTNMLFEEAIIQD